jgi:hypothetical protein
MKNDKDLVWIEGDKSYGWCKGTSEVAMFL